MRNANNQITYLARASSARITRYESFIVPQLDLDFSSPALDFFGFSWDFPAFSWNFSEFPNALSYVDTTLGTVTCIMHPLYSLNKHLQ